MKAILFVVGCALVIGTDLALGLFVGVTDIAFDLLLLAAFLLLVRTWRTWLLIPLFVALCFFKPYPHWLDVLDTPPFLSVHGFVGWSGVLALETLEAVMAAVGFGLIYFALGKGRLILADDRR